jgi:protocadherin delta 1
VGLLTAEDLDAFPHNAFTFRLDEGQVEGHVFTVQPDGTILTQHSLDREDVSVYEFRVKVASDVTYGVEDTAVVVVRVLDANDNNPVVTWPEQANQTIHISNRLPVGYSLAAVKVSTFTGSKSLCCA